MHLRLTVLLGVMFVAGSGCYRQTTNSEPPPAPAPSQQQPSNPTQCPPKDGRTIDITAGKITCDDAYSTVATFDWQGQKFQQIDGFMCYTGTAQTAPVVLVCSSDEVEFTVSVDNATQPSGRS